MKPISHLNFTHVLRRKNWIPLNILLLNSDKAEIPKLACPAPSYIAVASGYPQTFHDPPISSLFFSLCFSKYPCNISGSLCALPSTRLLLPIFFLLLIIIILTQTVRVQLICWVEIGLMEYGLELVFMKMSSDNFCGNFHDLSLSFFSVQFPSSCFIFGVCVSPHPVKSFGTVVISISVSHCLSLLLCT